MIAKSLSCIAWAVISLWSRSLKVHQKGRHAHDLLVRDGRTVIYAFWHDSMFLLPAAHRNSGIVVMVSESRDGEIMARLLKLYGFDVVRGSSKRKGHKALLALVHRMQRGKSVAFAVDGPRGPMHEVKEGAVFLAGIMQAPVIPVATASKQYRTAEKSWDKLMLPIPFTDGMVLFGEPLYINGTSPEDIQTGRKRLDVELRRLSQDAVLRLDTASEGRAVDLIRNAK